MHKINIAMLVILYHVNFQNITCWKWYNKNNLKISENRQGKVYLKNRYPWNSEKLHFWIKVPQRPVVIKWPVVIWRKMPPKLRLIT